MNNLPGDPVDEEAELDEAFAQANAIDPNGAPLPNKQTLAVDAGLKRMLDILVENQKAQAKVTPGNVAKAVFWRATAFSVFAAGRVRQVGTKVVSVVAKAVYEATREPEVPVERKTRDWDFSFEVSGKKGEVKSVVVEPEMPFKCEKLMVTDDGKGYHTGIMHVIVAGHLQSPAVSTSSTLALFYANNALGNGVSWDWCEPGRKISIQVMFHEDSTMRGVLWGKCEIEEPRR